MSFIEAVTTIDFPYRVAQQEVKQKARAMFTAGFLSAERLIDTFDNTGIKTRNFCQPLDYYSIPTNFEDRNKEYIRCALEFASTAGSLDMMGWEFPDAGFKVVFSRDIPAFISTHINGDIRVFLAGFGLILADLKYFIFHPGGKKVLDAYTNSLELEGDFLEKSRETMAEYGNMSSATVLYVLKKFIEGGLKKGYGLMLAMGPGFSSEMVLLNYA